MATLASRLADFAAAVRTKLNTMTPRLLPAGGAIGQVLTKSTATDYAASWTDPATGWTYLRITSDVSSSLVATNDITGLAFTPTASKDYEIEGKFLLQSSLATTAPRLGFALPSGLLDSGFTITEPTTSSTEVVTYTQGNVTTGQSTNTSWPAASVSFLSKMEGLMRCGTAPSGTFKMTIASEVAASAVTIKAGSFIRYRALN